MPPWPRTLRLALLFALLAGPAGAGAPIVVVDDTTFDRADWDLVVPAMEPRECRLLRDPPNERFCDQSGNDSSDGDMLAHGGSVGISGEGVVTSDAVIGVPVEHPLAYDPAVSGAIASVDAEFKLKHDVPTDGVDSTFHGHLLIEQAGDFYLSQARVSVTSMNGNPSAFEPFLQLGLVAASFEEITPAGIVPGSHPDFSATAAPLRFGWALDMAWNGDLPDRPFTTDFLNRGFHLDEYRVTVDPVAAAVPSLGPGWAPLLAALVIGLALWRGRRHRPVAA